LTELYKIGSRGQTAKIEKSQFSDEPKELEDFILKNERILGEVVLINRQIELPDKKRIDVWGVDLIELRPLIVELKNVATGLEVIPQILPYYNFVKSNPDTLKFKAFSDSKFMKKIEEWGKSKDELEKGLEQDPKVFIVAPSFENELSDTVNYLKFDTELIEISRYKTDEAEFFVTVSKPQSMITPPATVRVMEEWNWEKYQKEGVAKRKIDIAKGLKEQIDAIVEKEHLNLQPIFRKMYIPYQSGRNNVFWIDLGYTSWETGDVILWFYMAEKPDLRAEGIDIQHTRTKWLKDYNQWMIFFDKTVDLSPLTPVIKRSYEYRTGEKVSKS